MHQDLRDLLHTAEGQSRHVVVVFMDVRGFTSFAGIAESTDAADFLKCAYSTILDKYFPDSVFFKLTGDGMLLIYEYSDAASLRSTARKVATSSLKLVDAFATITESDPMVNVPVPSNLGIGLTRGSATALISGGTVLDYSGRPLNLGARLMDMARPSGVVIDESFGLGLLTPKVRALFTSEPAYIPGVSESKPIPVYFRSELTTIPERNKRPINALERISDPIDETTFGELKERGRFRHYLLREPAKTDDIRIEVTYPSAREDGGPHESLRWTPTTAAEYRRLAGNHVALIDYDPICELAESRGVQPDWPASTTVEYSVVPTAPSAPK
jgi:class 3 adenylate cyclase